MGSENETVIESVNETVMESVNETVMGSGYREFLVIKKIEKRKVEGV